MVTTRRNAAAPVEHAQTPSALERGTGAAPTPARRRAARKTAQAESQGPTTPSVASATSKTTRRTRSTAAASPLKSLEENKRNIPKSATKRTGQSGKRKRETANTLISSASATPEPESVRSQSEAPQDENDDEQGIFFTQNHISSSDSSSSPESRRALKFDSLIARSFSRLRLSSHMHDSYHQQRSSPKRYIPFELARLRSENQKLSTRVAQLEESNANLVVVNNSLHDHIYQLETRHWAHANQQPPSDFDDLPVMSNEETARTPARPGFVQGSESALALLHRIEAAALEGRAGGSESQTAGTPSSRVSQCAADRSESSSARPTATPRATPGFFSRSFSALKSKLGFTTPAPAPEAPAASPTLTPSRAPPAGTLTEALSGPPTPVGERSKAPPKKAKQNPMMRLLTKGVEPHELALAQNWAKHVIPTLKNDNNFIEKRRRLETSVLMKDLDNFPSSKPWESGFGDPLGDLDDDDVVPVWAVYLDMLAKEEEPKTKKRKSLHATSMDNEDTPSLNDLFGSSRGPQRPLDLFDSNGHSASEKDFHPRRSTEPSPMFNSPATHQEGKNVFTELKRNEEIAQQRAKELEPLQQATKDAIAAHAPSHNPAQGSFGLDYDSDDDDSTMISETSGETTDPVWTQPPPPAPVPAHAPLPNGSGVEPSSSASTQQPVDEVERQRQKLMKHTPAKPSRLREAFVPSPSLMSDAGNESILISTPLQPATISFDGVPTVEELDLITGELVTTGALQKSAAWDTNNSTYDWGDAILAYSSDEEEISSE